MTDTESKRIVDIYEVSDDCSNDIAIHIRVDATFSSLRELVDTINERLRRHTEPSPFKDVRLGVVTGSPEVGFGIYCGTQAEETPAPKQPAGPRLTTINRKCPCGHVGALVDGRCIRCANGWSK